MKRKATLIVLSLVCALFCAFGLAACGNNTSNDEENNELSYELAADGNSYAVSLPHEGDWENADIVIPAMYNQKPVTEIAEHGFEDEKIKSVIIPDSVKIIGIQAFADCENLKAVTFGNNVADIGDFAFNRTALETVTLPDSVKTVGSSAFANNNLLKEITVNGNAVFGDFIFDRCPVLEKAEFLGEDSIIFGAQMFSYSPALKELTIAAESAEFVYNTFTDCKPTKFAAPFEVVYKADFSDTIHAEPPKELVFLRTETFEKKDAVSKYSRTVTSITLPATLKTCKQNAFYSFNNLEKVNYLGTLGDWCGIEFQNGGASPLANGAELIIGGETVEGKLTVLAGVTKIKPYTFYHYKKITELEIAENVTEIGDYAFYGSALRTAKLIDGLQTIGKHTFHANPLYSVNLPESLTSIGVSAFEACRLVLVTLPQNLQVLGQNAFKANRMLTRLVLTQEQNNKGMSPDYTSDFSLYFESLATADGSALETVGDFLFLKDENGNYWLMGYLGSAKEITLPATVNGNKYAIHAYAFEITKLDKIAFEDTSNWQSKRGYDEPNDMDVSNPVINASNLQETFTYREWYQKDN